MDDTTPTHELNSTHPPRRWLRPLIVGLALLTVLPGALWAAFHCDEFVVMHHVTRFSEGQFRGSGRPGLLWAALLPIMLWDEPSSIVRAARLSTLIPVAATFFGVWSLAQAAREHPNGAPVSLPWAGIAAVALLVTSGNWQAHAFEVRTDTFVAPMTLLAALWLWRTEWTTRRAIALGLLVGAMGLISQKSIYNAAGLGLGWVVYTAVQVANGRVRIIVALRAAALAALAALALIGLWYGGMALLHGGTEFISGQMTSAKKTAFTPGQSLSAKQNALKVAAKQSMLLWGAAGLGVVWSLVQARRRPMGLALTLLLCSLLGTIFFHRGYFLYFIASFEPYAAALGGLALGSLSAVVHRRWGAWAAAILICAVLLPQGVSGWDMYRRVHQVNNTPQIELMNSVSETFPEPVPYWDSIGMIPGYEETTFFGTGLARTWFRRRTGKNGFIERAQQRKPHFYIRNYMTRRRYLQPAERRWLWTHYLPYRPNLYIHGGRMQVSKKHREAKAKLLVDSSYTVWFRGGWTGEATVDGKAVSHGEVVQLEAGPHQLTARAADGKGQLWLMLGEDRTPAAERPKDQVDYSMFVPLRRHRYQQYDDKRNERSDLRTPDHDITIERVNRSKRLARHRSWQRKVDKTDGRPK